MKLSDFFASEHGAQARLARELSIPAPLLSAWASENPLTRRRVPAERCPAIERATEGLVRCEDLRSDVEWAVLVSRKCPPSPDCLAASSVVPNRSESDAAGTQVGELQCRPERP
ncbi:MAG: hypothetical protein EON54_17435 [Alcaligenaceae bacterium]|nr:MAG: hypothetical protein EON54_17435 [Alcaligenaceae bacterium]